MEVNCLYTRLRTQRGPCRHQRDARCRAGFNSTEKVAYVIQGYFRIHSRRINRQNAACPVVASGLQQTGWAVAEEPRIQTSEGLQKHDLFATENDHVRVIYTQVVSDSQSLDAVHERRVAKYQDNSDLVTDVNFLHGKLYKTVAFSSCTRP